MPGVDILQETLLVKVNAAGVDRFGKRKEMMVSRKYYEAHKIDLGLELVARVKPEGFTMQEHKGEVSLAAKKERDERMARATEEAEEKTPEAPPNWIPPKTTEQRTPVSYPKDSPIAAMHEGQIPAEQGKEEKKLTPGQKGAITRKRNAEAKKAREAEAKAKEVEETDGE